jgi:hypothetical protein
MRSSIRRRALAFGAGGLIALSFAGTALADQFLGGEVHADERQLCLGQEVTFDRTGEVRRHSAGLPQWADGATLTFSVMDIIQPAVATVSIVVTDATIVLPADWTSQEFPYTASDTMSYTATIIATAVGEDAGALLWDISGEHMPGPIMPITVVECATPAPTPTPTPSPTPTPTPSPTTETVIPTMPPSDTAPIGEPMSSPALPVVLGLLAISGMALLVPSMRRRTNR